MWIKDVNIDLTGEDMQITNKHLKRCWLSFVIGELQIKMTYHYTPMRMTKAPNSDHTTPR